MQDANLHLFTTLLPAVLIYLSACASTESQAPFSTPYVMAWHANADLSGIATRLPIILTVVPSPTPTNTSTPTISPTSTVTPVPTVATASFGAIATAGADEAGAVRGQVVYLGQSIAGATVVLRQTGTGAEFGRVTTDAGGQFAFAGVPAGTWAMSATAPGGWPAYCMEATRPLEAEWIIAGLNPAQANFFRLAPAMMPASLSAWPRPDRVLRSLRRLTGVSSPLSWSPGRASQTHLTICG